jgi:Protein kinase domain
MSADDQMTDRLGPYRLLDRIGEGGMGVVYLARDDEQRTVAVKVLRPGLAAEPNALRRLAREVTTMRRVRSPFVAEVLGADLACDTPYIATRYVPGRTLDQVIGAQGPLQGAALAGLAQGLAEALAAVHASGVVHRDLKPSNVMMAGGTPVIIDFGIAQGPEASRLTMTGMFMGTPGYLSPEVIEGQPSSDASDVHAWGATVAFAATGRPPFGTGAYEGIFYRIVNGQPDLDGAPAALLPLLAAALSRDPARRPSAIQLSAQAAQLDPALLVPSLAVSGGQRAAATRLASATRADIGPVARPAAGLAGAGAAASVAADAFPGTDGFAGNGAGAAFAGAPGALPAGAAAFASPGTQPIAGTPRPADFADVLPPVAYGPPAGGPLTAVARPAPDYGPDAGFGRDADYGPDAGFGRDAGYGPGAGFGGDEGRARGAAGGYALMSGFSMVFLTATSVILPVAGTLVSLALIVLLRAGDGARRGTVLRRSARGARPTDAVISLVAFPWHLVRSVLALLFLSPVAAALAALTAALSLIMVQTDRVPHAVAYAAGALVAFYGLGPGSGRPRHQLSHLYEVVTSSRLGQLVALIVVVALAAGAATAAVSSPPLFMPLQPPALPHLGAGINLSPAQLLHGGPSQLVRIASKLLMGL